MCRLTIKKMLVNLAVKIIRLQFYSLVIVFFKCIGLIFAKQEPENSKGIRVGAGAASKFSPGAE
jgi:hypothetical protein